MGLYIGIMEKKMETTIVYWGNIGIVFFRHNVKLPDGWYRALCNLEACDLRRGEARGSTSV